MLHGIALRYFVEVARTGSLSASSENLHVAVSAISRQIAKLEEEVGTPLFERMPRGMVLTESGELLAQHARRALMDADAVLNEISTAHALGSGIVRVGCTEGFTRYFLPSVFATYHAAHPHKRFVLRSGTPVQVEHWVATGEVDLGLAFTTAPSTAVHVEFSVNAPVCALLRASHPLARKDVLTLDDLLEYPVAVLERGTTVRQLIDLCCSIRGRHLEPLMTSNNSSAMHQFAALGGAITLGSAIALQGMQDEYSLLAKPIDEPLLNERRLQITAMKERRLPPSVDQFLMALKDAVTASLPPE
ncbi:LysR family transcriptional regulator [Cupriavidus lacunae]|uniref:LysR family transcriptional regulator n=1 Tax=Cupriavidus lacunae TaxID=2666307 RepID=A0A370NNZ8_9BURK|nr:LysR family transcriptional regulator [Cupriavidus lacunae]RDK07340.1 LysR family transcriptional regulator [Cupriavidus lacunae]